jgi:small subunit ribosomal protein S7
MPRGARKVVKRIPPPDAKYSSITVAKFINRLMIRGQKSTAERIVYNALQLTAQQVNSEPEEALERAIRNATPLLMVKSRRVGGATYQVPTEVREDRGRALAMRWLIASARARWLMLPKVGEQQLRNVRIFTGWQRLTKPLLTIAGDKSC